MKNIDDLREVLFRTLAELRNPDAPMDISRARAINEVAQTLINTAKVECDWLRGQKGAESRFMRGDVTEERATATGIEHRDKRGSVTVIAHKLVG
jgi:hypothetical protein